MSDKKYRSKADILMGYHDDELFLTPSFNTDLFKTKMKSRFGLKPKAYEGCDPYYSKCKTRSPQGVLRGVRENRQNNL